MWIVSLPFGRDTNDTFLQRFCSGIAFPVETLYWMENKTPRLDRCRPCRTILYGDLLLPINQRVRVCCASFICRKQVERWPELLASLIRKEYCYTVKVHLASMAGYTTTTRTSAGKLATKVLLFKCLWKTHLLRMSRYGEYAKLKRNDVTRSISVWWWGFIS